MSEKQSPGYNFLKYKKTANKIRSAFSRSWTNFVCWRLYFFCI